MATPAIGITVWGFVTGVAMVNAGLPVALALVMTLMVFAGSAQLAALPLLAVGAPLPVVWVTAALVNLRFVIFSAGSCRFFSPLPWWQRLFASYFNGDVGFALFINRFRGEATSGTPHQWGYFYGGAALNWVTWQAGSIAGILVGNLAPSSWGLDLAAVLALVAVVVPMLASRPALVGVVVTGVLSVVTIGLPYKLGLLSSIIVGVVAALGAEALVQKPSREPAH
jgi:predicted branched-subunit amino acid permease